MQTPSGWSGLSTLAAADQSFLSALSWEVQGLPKRTSGAKAPCSAIIVSIYDAADKP